MKKMDINEFDYNLSFVMSDKEIETQDWEFEEVVELV